MDSYCKRDKPKIIESLRACNANGDDVNKIFNKKRNFTYVFDKYLADKKFEDTNLTYSQVKEKCQAKYETEKARIKVEKQAKSDKLKKDRKQALKENNLLAKKAGYKGYTHFSDMEMLIVSAQNGEINIGDYVDTVIEFRSGGTYAYKFSQINNGIEIYQPDYRYGLKSTIGIKREKEQNNQILEGQPLKNIEIVSFLGVKKYRTVLGASKQILIFDRAADFRLELVMKALEKKLAEKK